MSSDSQAELPSGDYGDFELQRRRIRDVWCQIEACDSPGGTTWEVLENIRKQVMQLLGGKSLDECRKADRLTSHAAFLWLYGKDG